MLRARSIQFGAGVTSAAPGSAQGLYLVVSDIVAARTELVHCAVKVSEVYHRGAGADRLSGPDPRRESYASFASFSDGTLTTWSESREASRFRDRTGRLE
jgi:hypothetical protein